MYDIFCQRGASWMAHIEIYYPTQSMMSRDSTGHLALQGADRDKIDNITTLTNDAGVALSTAWPSHFLLATSS